MAEPKGLKIVFAFDGDTAGRAATKRAVRVAHNSLLVPQMIEQDLREQGWEIPDAGPFLDDWLLSCAPEHANCLLFALGGEWKRRALKASMAALAEAMNDYVLLHNETLGNEEAPWWYDYLWRQAETISTELQRRHRAQPIIRKDRYQRIKEDNELVATISRDTKLIKRGKSWVGLCPFHDDRTPSLSVSETKQLWSCFGCGKGGDVITWLQLKGRI